MKTKKKVIILQIDGLGYKDALEAIHNGHMPFLKTLLSEEEYEILRYRSGIPSSTPYVQAGLLYGDNAEIPSFQWWDRRKKRRIQVIGERSFHEVSHKYFKKSKPLLEKGAAIASLFAGGAKAAFAVSYVEKGTSQFTNSLSKNIYLQLFLNPLQNAKWHWHTFKKSIKIGYQVIKSVVKRRYVDWLHFPVYLMDQWFLFYPTSLAIKKAIGSNFPVTYAGFYSYDNFAHIFGKKTSHSNSILRDIDNALKSISSAIKKKEESELIILSDHGETKFQYFGKRTGKSLSEYLSKFLPEYQIKEYPGKSTNPKEKKEGEIALTYTGGLAHFYDTSVKKRLNLKQIMRKFPNLIDNMVRIPEIAGVLVREDNNHLLLTKDKVFSLNEPLSEETKMYLKRFDNPEIVAKQLSDLNSFKNSGDIIILADHDENFQISFETLAYGHGSIGNGQSHPFILLKKSHQLDTSSITDARYLHPFLSSLVA